LVVFFQDECHLLWGDLCGYIWGETKARIEVPIVNERERQTYYGAVNFYTQQCLIQAALAGNSLGHDYLPQIPPRPVPKESYCPDLGWCYLT